MTHYDQLISQFRHSLACEGDNGMAVAADAFTESDDSRANRFGELLRKYIEIQTFVRMSSAPPAALVESYNTLNNSFGTPAEFKDGSATYTKPFGPYYTALKISQQSLVSNWDRLTDQPVRELEVTGVSFNDDLAMILRNYRMEVMYQLTLRMFSYRTEHAAQVGEYIKKLKAPMLIRLSIHYVEDPKGLIKLGFQTSGVRKGAELWVSNRYYDQPGHVATKRIAPPNMKM